MRRISFLSPLFLLLLACSPVDVERGAVASAEQAATGAGLEVLRAGGGAVDAAVAVALALAVVQPQAGNLGGGGFAVVKWGEAVDAIDFRETAPAAARRDMFRDADGNPLPEGSTVGPLAAGVPGSPSGLFELHRRYGTVPWRDVVQPAVRLARDGFIVSERLHSALVKLRDRLGRFPETSTVWLPDGEPPHAGSRMKLPQLARTLQAYAEQGPPGIISGPVAAAVERASKRHGGILTASDLASYRPVWRQPIRLQAFGWEVASMPLPSSGGIILGQSLLMLEALEWPALPRDGAARVHLLAETWRRAYADRYLLGDPASSRADASQLLDPSWVARRRAGIDPGRASLSSSVRPWSGEPVDGPTETTHLSVVDTDGNLVALTTTLNGWFGCYLLVDGAGFFLNNEMDDFATIPERPNFYELVQGEANTVRAGARMLSSMTPTVAWRGDAAIALGSPGGGRIPTATLQVLLHLIVDGDSLENAIERPRAHHQWQPDVLLLEPGAVSAAVKDDLLALGHRLHEVRALGEVHVVRRGAEGVEAAADRRGPGAAGVATGD